MKKTVTGAVLAFSLSGCASLIPAAAPPVELVTQWTPEDHKAWEGTGSATIRGQAFLRQNGGGVVTCAGQTVALVPDTPYYREAIGIMTAGRRVAPTGNDTSHLRRLVTCDAQGRFEFPGVPSESWMVATEVSWMVGYAKQGGAMLRTVQATDGGVVDVIMTEADRR